MRREIDGKLIMCQEIHNYYFNINRKKINNINTKKSEKMKKYCEENRGCFIVIKLSSGA